MKTDNRTERPSTSASMILIFITVLILLFEPTGHAYWRDQEALDQWLRQSDFESVTASSEGPYYLTESNIDYLPENAADSDWYSTWVSKTSKDQWLKVTFKQEKNLSEIIFLNLSEGADQIRKMDIEFSDGATIPYDFPRSDVARDQIGQRTLHGEQRTLFYNYSVNAGEAFPFNQGPHRIKFEPRRVKWVKFNFTDPGNAPFVTVTDVRFRGKQPEAPSFVSFSELRNTLPSENDVHWGRPDKDWRFRNDDFGFDVSRETGMMTNLCSLRPFEVSVMTAMTYPRVEVSSVWMSWDSPRGECLIDDDIGTDWASHREGAGAWFKIYLAEREIVSKLVIQRSASVPNNVARVRLDFEDSSYVYSDFAEKGTETLEDLSETIEFAPRATRWVKVTVTDVKDPGGNVRLGAARLYCLRNGSAVEVPRTFRPASLGLYLWNRDTGVRYHLDRLVAYGPVDGGAGLRCLVAGPDEHGNVAAYARVTYGFEGDLLKLKVDVKYLFSSSAVWEVGVYQPFDHRKWPGHVDTAGPMDSDNAYGRAFNSHYIEMFERGDWGGLVYPMGMLMRDDRSFMYGSFDLMTYVVSYPHHIPDTTPHLIVSPIGIQNSDGWTFDLFYKIHPASPDAYPDALRWYVQRTHMDHPDLVDKGIKVRLKENRATTLPEGCVSGGSYDWSMAVAKRGPKKFRELIEAEERGLLDMKMINKWYGPFPAHTRGETFPTDGVFSCQAPWSKDETVTFTPQDVLEDAKRLQSKGYYLYLYARQMSIPPGHHRWLDYAVSELREWYMNHLKAAIDYYGFDGIAWDYAWSSMGPMCGGRYFSGNPNMSMMHGYLLVQAQMRKWLDETYPDNYKHMLGNLSQGGACTLFYDAALQEGQTTLIDGVQFDALMTPQSGYFAEGFLSGRLGALWKNEPEQRKEVVKRLLLNNVVEAQGRGVSVGGHMTFKTNAPDRAYADSLPWWGGDTNYDGITDTLTALARFGARSLAVPRISGDGVVAASCESVVSRLWGDENNLMATVYNDSLSAVEYRVRISLAKLAEFGVTEPRRLNSTLIGRDAVPIPGADLKQTVDDHYLYLEGKLEGKRLLLLESDRLSQ